MKVVATTRQRGGADGWRRHLRRERRGVRGLEETRGDKNGRPELKGMEGLTDVRGNRSSRGVRAM
uniref:Uncharacterized protein n=1 Tax=Oryza sativa subsp. japonica TaxID=39947 RepID=Q69IS3_ORYSJ|nr:hypothetical protein [Oryza sativa Japonica Group]